MLFASFRRELFWGALFVEVLYILVMQKTIHKDNFYKNSFSRTHKSWRLKRKSPTKYVLTGVFIKCLTLFNMRKKKKGKDVLSQFIDGRCILTEEVFKNRFWTSILSRKHLCKYSMTIYKSKDQRSTSLIKPWDVPLHKETGISHQKKKRNRYWLMN